MNIREEITNTIRHNDPLAGHMVLVPGKVFEKLLLPNKSQDPIPGEDGYDIPWGLEESTIKYIIENEGELIGVDDVTPDEIIVVRKYLIDKNNPRSPHLIHEIRCANAKGHRYLRHDEPTFEEFLFKRMRDIDTNMEKLLKQGTYVQFTEDLLKEYSQMLDTNDKNESKQPS